LSTANKPIIASAVEAALVDRNLRTNNGIRAAATAGSKHSRFILISTNAAAAQGEKSNNYHHRRNHTGLVGTQH
jgi:hypothetical protein